jgi:Tfp pilus assembly protein FimT
MLIAVTLLGLMLAIAAPRIQEANAIRNVKNGRAAVANLYARARVYAVQARVPTTLQFSDSAAWITAPAGAGLDTIGSVERLGLIFGVALNASGSISVSPTGLVTGAPVKVLVTKGSKSDSLLISGYGKMQ